MKASSRAELRIVGVGPSKVRAQISAGRWQLAGLAVVGHNGPLTDAERRWAALVSCGPRSVLTAFTAAEVHGLTGWERPSVHVLAPAGTRCRGGGAIEVVLHTVQRSTSIRRLGERRVQRLSDALCVAAATFSTPRPACGLLSAAVQQRLTVAAHLREAVMRSTRMRHRAALLLAVDDIEQGAHALSEIDFVRLCRQHRIPPPIQQLAQVEVDGRRRYLDAWWRRSDGRTVAAEVDGALHLAPTSWWGDQLRQNEIAIADAIVLRFPTVVVRHEQAVVADQLRRALRLV